jgi:peroxisomal 3,2-trans-enoyl-CoA isomerase
MAGPISLEYKGRIAVITIADESKLNALSQDGYYQLATYMREVAQHDEVFITVLTGKGMLRFSPIRSRSANSS